MRMKIQVKAMADEPDLRERAERRLRFALGRYADEIRMVRLVIDDLNGPRRGIDKRCTVKVAGPRLAVVFLEESDSLASRALDRLTDRLARTIARTLDRAREFPEKFIARPTRSRRAA